MHYYYPGRGRAKGGAGWRREIFWRKIIILLLKQILLLFLKIFLFVEIVFLLFVFQVEMLWEQELNCQEKLVFQIKFIRPFELVLDIPIYRQGSPMKVVKTDYSQEKLVLQIKFILPAINKVVQLWMTFN